jgi:hypothetical protein
VTILKEEHHWMRSSVRGRDEVRGERREDDAQSSELCSFQPSRKTRSEPLIVDELEALKIGRARKGGVGDGGGEGGGDNGEGGELRKGVDGCWDGAGWEDQRGREMLSQRVIRGKKKRKGEQGRVRGRTRDGGGG